MSKSPRHFLDLFDVPTRDLRTILDASTAMKKKRKAGDISDRPLDGKTLAMIFDKPSTRTRVSFDVGMRQLGGETIMLTGTEMQLGRSETIADTAKVLSRYVDAIMIRTTSHDRLLELTESATNCPDELCLQRLLLSAECLCPAVNLQPSLAQAQSRIF